MKKPIWVEWIDGLSGGYIDEFPVDLFEVEGTRNISHTVIGTDGTRETVECSLKVEGQHADFTYSQELCDPEDWYLGIIRLNFTDANRKTVTGAEWQSQGSNEFDSKCLKLIENLIPNKPRRSVAIDLTKKLKLVPARPEQPKFRNALLLLQGGCVISGCQVLTVLDAAHIAPVSKKGEFHPTNGLLLRTDLHRLFDANLLAINPDNLTIHFAASVRLGEYENWHGGSIKIPPYLDEDEKPCTEFLVWRWRFFPKD